MPVLKARRLLLLHCMTLVVLFIVRLQPLVPQVHITMNHVFIVIPELALHQHSASKLQHSLSHRQRLSGRSIALLSIEYLLE